jgi:D-glycero-alpha-D-manno-heptose 1-phosphate guanylyltransferase
LLIKQCAILVGGKGTRLWPLTASTPKPMLDVGGSPFLERLLRSLEKQGFEDILLLCCGFQDLFSSYVKSRTNSVLNVKIVQEIEHLGTGGALRNAYKFLDDQFFVLNGDTFFDADFRALETGESYLCKIAVRKVPDVSRFGQVIISERGLISSFDEKGKAVTSGLINSGVYLMKKEAIDLLSTDGHQSIEFDLFPRLVEEQGIAAMELGGYFIDIGVPDDLARARRDL